MIETFAPSHIPFFLGHNPGISSSWDLEKTGGLQSDFKIPQIARCFTFICVIQKPMIPCYLNAPWTLAQFFPFKNGCTLHRRALEMKQSQQSLEWNLQHVEEYLDIWIFVLIASLSLDSDDLRTEQPLHKFHDPPCRRRSIAGSHGSSFWPCLEPKPEGSQVEKNLDPKKSPTKQILQADSYKFPC